MNKGIEWALNEAREDLKTTGRVYRMESTREGWVETFGPDSLETMTEQYEKSCHELRAIIKDLEIASRVVIIDLKERPKSHPRKVRIPTESTEAENRI